MRGRCTSIPFSSPVSATSRKLQTGYLGTAGEQDWSCARDCAAASLVCAGYSAFRTYRHDGYRLQPKNWFPALLPDLAVLRTSGLPHLAQVVVLPKRCFK